MSASVPARSPPRPARPRRQARVEVSFPVVGMTCASCSNRIERFLRKTDGVVEANVNLATEVATIRYLPEAVGRGELVGAIEKAGYEVRPGSLEAAEARATGAVETATQDDELDETERIRAREQRELGIQSAVSIGVAIGIMVLMFAPLPLTMARRQPARPLAGDLHPVLGRAPLLPGRLEERPPRRHEHEHARRRRHQRRLGLLASS